MAIWLYRRKHFQWWNDFSNLQELPLLHQKEHNLLLLLVAFFKGWDAQFWHQTASGLLYHEGSRLHITGLLPLESFGGLIWILNLLISPDISSVVSYLNR